MNIAIFGGTFDTVHRGHIELASAAQQRFDLKQVLFVPAYIPPHKQREPITRYEHRYAMLALALAEHKTFLPSLLEAPDENREPSGKVSSKKRDDAHVSYSIDTVRRLKRQLRKSDRLFFLIGIDAFLDIAKWREPENLLAECEFIVVSRPGYSMAKLAEALPESSRPRKSVTKAFQKQPASGELVLPGVHLHLLDDVNIPVSATKVRHATLQKRSVSRFLDPAVAEYIRKMALYRNYGKHNDH